MSKFSKGDWILITTNRLVSEAKIIEVVDNNYYKISFENGITGSVYTDNPNIKVELNRKKKIKKYLSND